MIPTTEIRSAEIDLISHGYTQRLWRRGIMGTRVFARGSERIVLVRNSGQDRHPQEDEAAGTVENWFERLQAVLNDLVKGVKLTDLLLFGDADFPVPEPFLDWCKTRGIQVHAEKASFVPRAAPISG